MNISATSNSIHDFYSIVDKIDQGAFGTVYKAICKASGQLVAVKHIRAFSPEKCHTGINEIRSLRNLDHENIVKIKDVRTFGEDLFIIYEYAATNLLKFYSFYKTQVG